MDNDIPCSDCKHRFAVHYTNYGGMMGCGQGTKYTIREYSQMDRDVVTLRCMCHGFAEVVQRDMAGQKI
jgi:hypothetical protein